MRGAQVIGIEDLCLSGEKERLRRSGAAGAPATTAYANGFSREIADCGRDNGAGQRFKN